MIKAVLFDYGGVLTPGGFDDSMIKLFAETYGVDESEIKIDTLFREVMKGNLTTDEFFSRMNAKFPGKQKATASDMLVGSPQIFEKADRVYELAERLRTADIRTGIFSNVSDFVAKKRIELGDYDAFDPVLLSYRDRMVKPDLEYYKYALKNLNLPADEVLFIDDKERNLIPARELGIHTIKFENADQIIRDTKAFIENENHIVLDR
ncbi:MAG TPA: HAD family phosphatase [Candidatus Saccharimonadales bacterium]|nr:HAD family phosphatase [Candidatus Saccharimonadales bacterium]